MSVGENDTPTEEIKVQELLQQLYRKMIDLENEVVKLTELHVSLLEKHQSMEITVMTLLAKLKKHAVLADLLREL